MTRLLIYYFYLSSPLPVFEPFPSDPVPFLLDIFITLPSRENEQIINYVYILISILSI